MLTSFLAGIGIAGVHLLICMMDRGILLLYGKIGISSTQALDKDGVQKEGSEEEHSFISKNNATVVASKP